MTKQLTHWSDEVSDCDVAELAGITTKIDACLVKVASSLIEIGHALNRARVLIPGDKEFGLWRAERTPFTDRQAENYMKVAKKFTGHTLVAKTSLAVLVELTSASPELIKKVEAKLDAGEKVTKQDVRKAKKNESLPTAGCGEGTVHEPMTNKEFPQTEENNPFAPRTTHTVIESDEEDPPPLKMKDGWKDTWPTDDTTPVEQMDDLSQDLIGRIRIVQDKEMDTVSAWFVFGMETPERDPNKEVIDILYKVYSSRLHPDKGGKDAKLQAVLNKAKAELDNQY